jgi:Tyrosyl-DNA phosphodiesterase
VWWQDFPRRESVHYSSLFGPTEEDKSDFGTHLACFVASLINEVPSQAHWVDLLANYDFGEAACHLVASVPGVHAPIPPYLKSDYCLSVSGIYKILLSLVK